MITPRGLLLACAIDELLLAHRGQEPQQLRWVLNLVLARAARTQKLAKTDWQMSIESNSRLRRGSTSRTRASRRIAGS
jgi:hypothetical protein